MKNVLLAIALLLTGCITVEVEEPELCGSYSITIPAAPINFDGAWIYFNVLPYSVSPVDDWVSEAHVLRGNLTSSTGSFGFLNGLAVSLVADGLEDLVLLNAASPETRTDELLVSGNDTNVISYIQDGYLRVRFGVATSSPPTYEWQINANLCLDGIVREKFGL